MLKKGFPEHILYLKIAESAARFAQAGQYNLARMSGRGDGVAVRIMQSEAMKEAMKLCHYLSGVYPPHDKWLFRSMQTLPGYGEIAALIQQLAYLDAEYAGCNQDGLAQDMGSVQTVAASGNSGSLIVEEIADKLCRNMYALDIISDIQPYLEAHTEELLRKSSLCRLSDQELVQKIAEAEFDAFDKVKNEGGRAACQNDGYTFFIMRKSQYQTWSRTMLIQYLYDFQREISRGHNLIEEKYARMMASTAPDEFIQIEKRIIRLAEEKKDIVEAVVQMQVAWMEEFEKEHPGLAGNARSIHSIQDDLYNTSYETYLRGEISTYSDKMLELYGRYVVEHASNGLNIASKIMTCSVRLYGYADLKDAEQKLDLDHRFL